MMTAAGIRHGLKPTLVLLLTLLGNLISLILEL